MPTAIVGVAPSISRFHYSVSHSPVYWSIAALLCAPAAVVLALPLVSDVLSLVTILFRSRRSGSGGTVARQRLLVLVAAHDEELLISDAVRSMVGMRREHCDFDLIVVADNCGDRTAELAEAAGARVFERRDLTRIGKPWALQYAMGRVPLEQYDAVVIVDADTIVDPGFVDAFARRGPLRTKAVQSYCAISNERDSWLTLLGALLVSVRYDWQYEIKRRAGLNCPIGNGWCVGTGLLARAGWAPESLTETWELYTRYTVVGAQVDFARDALMRGQEAATLRQGAIQRRRWQAGKLVVFARYWRRVLKSRIGWRQKLDTFGELAAPGPVLHASLVLPIAVAFATSPSTIARSIALLMFGSLLPILLWTAVALVRHPQRFRLLGALARIPGYAVWRVWVGALAFATARSGVWYRSPRHLSPQRSELP